MVDSSVFINFFNNIVNSETYKLDELLKAGEVCIGDYILAEVLQGIRNDNQYRTVRKMMGAFDCFNILNRRLAMRSAENYRLLRKRGVTVRKTVDVIIGTFCIENNLRLLHNDKDFIPLEKYLGLKTVN